MCYSALIRQDLKIARLDEMLREMRGSVSASQHQFSRIFPGLKSVVLSNLRDETGLPVVLNLPYSFLPKDLTKSDGKRWSTYNARVENLESSRLWRQPLTSNRGLICAAGFYEWGKAGAMLDSGLSTREELATYFEKAWEHKKSLAATKEKPLKQLDAGAKDLSSRKIPLFFKAKEARSLLIPVLYSTQDGGGFAIITRSAGPLVSAVGHPRSPVVLGEEEAHLWLSEDSTSQRLLQSLREAKVPDLKLEMEEA